jgi:NADH pyrophosphatase NudC (nudix superfamily)
VTDLQQSILTASGTRRFACHPLALQAILVDLQERVLLLSSPTRTPGRWQVVSGAMEARETVLDGVLRETYEELGPDVRVRPLGVVHAQSFHYDARVRYMVGIYYLLAYEGGEIVPGDDMAGSVARWFAVDELDGLPLCAAPGDPWLLRRAVALYRLWRDEEAPLQAVL